HRHLRSLHSFPTRRSSDLMGLPYAFASHFAPAHLHAALRIYHENFVPSEQLKKPYTMACINIIAADTDEEASLLETSLKQQFLGDRKSTRLNSSHVKISYA